MSIKEIVVDAKKRKNEVTRIMEERKTEAEEEYETTKIQRLITEEKARIKELQGQGQPVPSGMATDFTARIMQLAQVDPAKAKAFLDGLDEDNLSKMAYLMAMENDRTGAFLTLAKSSGTSTKDLIEVAKMMRSNGGTDLKGVAEVFKLGLDAGRANQPQPQSMQEAANFILGIVKPFQESLAASQKEAIAAQIETIKAKMPPSPQEYLTSIREGAKELGLGQAGNKSELDLKLEEMRQSHDLDMQKLSWEQQKYILGLEADRDKWGAIQQTFSPIFSMAAPEIRGALRKAGEQVGKMMETPQKSPPQGTPNIVTFTCPECSTELSVPLPPNAPEEVPVKCPKCGTITPAKLTKPTAPETPPQEEKPRSTQLRASYT